MHGEKRGAPRALKEAATLTSPVQRLKTAGKSLLPLTCPRKKQWRMSLLSVPLRPSAPKCTTVYAGAMKSECAVRFRWNRSPNASIL